MMLIMRTLDTSTRTLSAALFAAALAIAANAQSTAPSPRPSPPADDGEVVKISTTLIQLDVTVTDRKGKVIGDLTADDFEIFENKQKQKITGLTFISSVRERTTETARPAAADIPLPPTTIRPEEVRRTIALVVDDLSLSFESAYYTRRTLRKFVDEQMQEGDLVAIIRTGAGVGALQQFTANKRMLHAAIERIKWNPLGYGGISAFAPIEPTPLQTAQAAGDTSISEEDLAREADFMADVDDFRSSAFASGTLGALRFVVEGMRELPGRKSVVMFSDGFRIVHAGGTELSGGGRVMEYLVRLIDIANRASVVFYTVDPRGLQVIGLTAADRLSSASADAVRSALDDRRGRLWDTQGGLQFLARETGGFAIINQNDLVGGMKRILDDQSYYLIAYEPDTDTFDPVKRRFNKVEVKVKRKDVNVRYRSGFFNVASESLADRPKPELSAEQQVQRALTSPFAINDISLSLNSLFGNDPALGNFVRSLLHISADDLKFNEKPDGTFEAEIGILAAAFGQDGAVADHVSRGYTLNVDKAGYAKIRSGGFVYHFTFPVKKPGPYQYRVAIRDQLAGTVGSASQFLEVPNLKKGNPVISGIALQNFTLEQWNRFIASGGSESVPGLSNPMNDTSLRRFRAGTILQFACEFYNAKLDPAKQPNVTTRIRVFREGKLVLDGEPQAVKGVGQPDVKRLKWTSAITLAEKMEPGDYILQVIATDNNSKSKRRMTTQYVNFEIFR